MPPVTEFKEEKSHRQIAQTHPNGIALFVEIVTEEGKGHPDVPLVPDETPPQVNDQIDHEEGKEEPARRIAVELALLPQVTPTNGAPRRGEQARPAVKETKINGITDKSPHQIGYQQTFGLVLDECPRITRHRLVEVTGLEEEETQEEERPGHQLLEPELIAQTAHPDDMQHDHADNT